MDIHQKRWKEAWGAIRLLQSLKHTALNKGLKQALYNRLTVDPHYMWIGTMVIQAKASIDPLKSMARRVQQDRVPRLQEEMTWHPDIDEAYVKRKIAEGLRDIYSY